MANRRRGEIAATFDGREHTLCLTLGALCELEQAFGVDDLMALAERFEKGRIAALDAQKIIAAGLKGGGHTLTFEEVGELRIEGGAAGYVRIVAELLAVTFAGETPGETMASASRQGTPMSRPRQAREGTSPPPAPPFPGMR